MKKALLAIALAATFNAAHADSFQVGGGFGSSATLSGGSQATSGSNGNGFSYQTSNSNGGVYAVGATALGVGYSGQAIGGVSGSYAVGGSVTNANSYGTTGYDGYGSTKSGVGADYSSYGNNGIAASYKY